jgi:DnaJ like chaperone protein
MLVAASNHVKAASSAQKRILKRDIINHTADQFVNALNNHNAKAKYQEHLYSVIDKAENTDLSIFEAAQNLMQYNLDHDTIVNIFGQVVSLIRIDDEAGTKRDELSKLATNFYHINNSKVQNVLDMIYGEQSHSKSSSSNATSAELDQCYKVLGCSNFDSDEKIKKAYRELSRKFHPDYIQGKDLHEDFLSFATSKMQEINMAYEKIKNARGSF